MIGDDDIEDWEDFEEVDLSKKRYVSDETRMKMSIAISKSQSEIIERFKKLHGERYDYSKVVYKGQFKKVCIICETHGEFLKTPNEHFHQNQGCPICAKLKAIKNTTHSLEKVLEKFRKIHGDRYDYSKVEYVHARTKVVITCRKHGDFKQRPNDHQRGMNCPECAKEENRERQSFGIDKVLSKFKKVHGNKYDYSKVVYVNRNKKVVIICKKHGEFLQGAGVHWIGSGCPKCARLKRGQNV